MGSPVVPDLSLSDQVPTSSAFPRGSHVHKSSNTNIKSRKGSTNQVFCLQIKERVHYNGDKRALNCKSALSDVHLSFT